MARKVQSYSFSKCLCRQFDLCTSMTFSCENLVELQVIKIFASSYQVNCRFFQRHSHGLILGSKCILSTVKMIKKCLLLSLLIKL